MIITKLMGGLGNQMFQYAVARRLAYIHNVPLKLDLNWYGNIENQTQRHRFRRLAWFGNVENVDTSRRYELHVFNIAEDFASMEELIELKKDRVGDFPGIIKKFIHALTFFCQSSWVREKHFHFQPSILDLPDNVYLEGFWQTEKYFKDIENIIRKDFTFKTEPDHTNRQIAETIKNTESVSIHVRRGDYVSNPIVSQYHGTCSLDYYRRAVSMVTQQAHSPHFFIFSDDPDWVKNNLKLQFPSTFISHNGTGKAYEDLRLLSLCKHHIVANSSFSWWGAWLCENPGKIVVAPQKWFKDPAINTSDILPSSWIKID